MWDATCPDTFAPSHRGHATRSAGCVGEQAEGKKAEKYAHLAPAYLFQLVAMESSGAIGSRAFLCELGRRVGAQTGEAKSTSYLSRDSLWPYSVGMLRLSWVVPPPAQVEPMFNYNHFNNN